MSTIEKTAIKNNLFVILVDFRIMKCYIKKRKAPTPKWMLPR